MIDDKDKHDHHLVLSTHLNNDIQHEGLFLPISILLTTFFILQKLNDNLMAKWQATFYPIFLYIIYNIIKYFIKIIKSETEENSTDSKIKIDNYSRIILISNLFGLINTSLSFFIFYNLSEFLDKKEDDYMLSALYIILAICCSSMIYTIIRKSKLFSLRKQADANASEESHLGFISTLTGPLLTYLSNMMIVCSSSSGVCTQVYMSTITSLLGAFGVTISDFSECLFPITLVMLGISLYSLYAKKKKLTHKPFLLGVFSTVLILIAHVFKEGNAYYLVYPGNILMIAAAIWNARMNKFYGLPKYNK